eukprot:COSAG05_NODE_1269_length_5318_cov_3.679824_1_plen_41_part_00
MNKVDISQSRMDITGVSQTTQNRRIWPRNVTLYLNQDNYR